jgi:uncharacterized protein YcsI (UPF0317 family)
MKREGKINVNNYNKYYCNDISFAMIITCCFQHIMHKIYGTTFKNRHLHVLWNVIMYYTGYFTSDNEQGVIENATHNTFPKLTWLLIS